MRENITVTIWCITYNHAKYISGAIESFLNQKTSFNYEILIHDDCSTDGTVEILQEYEKRYPGIIKVFYEEENQYSKGKLRDKMYEIVEQEARGDYIALCEGDDFWIDNQKLQIQVDYMEKHQDCVMTAHNGLQLDMRDGNLIAIDGLTEEKDVSVEEVLIHYKNCFPTASMIMKRDLYILQEPYRQCLISDWPLMISAVLTGKIHYFDRIMSVYRVFGEGSWTEAVKRDVTKHLIFSVDMARLFKKISHLFEFRYQKTLSVITDGFISEGAGCLLDVEENDLERLHEAVFGRIKCLEECYWNDIIEYRDKVQSDFEKMLCYISGHKYLYIMGTGDVSNYLSEQLGRLQINYDGYVVSDGQPVREKFWNRNVIRLSEVAGKDGVGIVIAIKKKMKNVIEPVLEANSITDYFWFGM